MTVLGTHGSEQRPFPDRHAVNAVEIQAVREEFEKRYPIDSGAVREKELDKRNDARWTIGGGIEWALGNNWTLKGEYMFIGSDNNSACAVNPGVFGGLPAGNYCWNHSGFDGISTAKTGLNYLFGGLFGGGAPFARY